MPRSDDEERPKKSWRERDKAKDRGGSGKTSSDRERERFEKTSAYSRYKTNLEKVFSGGELSQAMRDRIDPEGKKKSRDALLAKIREAESTKAFIEAIDALLSVHELPDDPYLLDRCLDHPAPAVQLKALERLRSLAADGKLPKPPPSLKQRLQTLELMSDDPAVQDEAVALSKRLF
ncbi:MAG: hypothetical protein ACYCWW_09620 [Deltaproteobacteria bacterium]